MEKLNNLQNKIKLINILNKRLKVTIARNGITFVDDVRNRHKWINEGLRTHEIIVVEEMNAKCTYKKIKEEMGLMNIDDEMQGKLFREITGVDMI